MFELSGCEMKAKRCPCGEFPSELTIFDANQGGKWAFVVGACCSEWHVEFRTMYNDIESEACRHLALSAWNDAPRGNDERKEKQG